METCCCGNPLGSSRIPVRRSPCRCDAPGPGPGQLSHGLPHWVTKRQYESRRKLGLPVVTPAERAIGFRPR